MEHVNSRGISGGSPEFPPLLKALPDAPSRLFVAGSRLEPAPFVAVVGTRRPTRYGVEVAEQLARDLARNGVVVVSGMARGIDAAAHRGALAASAPTIGVLGSGLDVWYPKANAALFRGVLSRGTLISEYEDGHPPLRQNFPARNRIIAGMSMAVVIVEGRRHGGAMITARLGIEYGREVFAIPGPVHAPQSEGSHLLVRDGARLVTSAEDILDDLGLPYREAGQIEMPALSPDEVRVLETLGAHPSLIDSVAGQLHMPTSTVAAIVSRLELKSLVSRYPGGRFASAVPGG